jgi:hypothetical protein
MLLYGKTPSLRTVVLPSVHALSILEANRALHMRGAAISSSRLLVRRISKSC